MRREFVLKVLERKVPVAELCRRYGISRKTGYKWLERFKEQGLAGLVDESRRPLSSPLETTTKMALEIVELRQSHITWGARKLQRLLERTYGESAPSAATVARILERAGLIRKRRRRPPSKGLPLHRPEPVIVAPNDLWTVDFKGWWRTLDGTRCDPLTVRDAFSRYVLDLRLVHNMTAATVRQVFEELFERYGVPKAIQSDNGQPFVSTMALAGLTKLSAWWVSLGIERVRSRLGSPQDNGGHERMHADICRELQTPPAATLELQQCACDGWRTEFNHVRPHEALGMKTPAELYKPSQRRPVVRVGGIPDGCEHRVVDTRGWVTWEMQKFYVSTALAHYTIGLKREGRLVTVWFFELLVGSFSYGEDETVHPYRHVAAPHTGPMSPVVTSPSPPGGRLPGPSPVT